MVNDIKFFICNHCGNLATKIIDKGVPLVCCGEKMRELVANTADASVEKHLPIVTIDGDKVSVKVGSAPHPMTEAHYISYIYLHTLKGVQYKYVSGEATADFCVTDDKPIAVYAYCNLHGLWKTQLN